MFLLTGCFGIIGIYFIVVMFKDNHGEFLGLIANFLVPEGMDSHSFRGKFERKVV